MLLEVQDAVLTQSMFAAADEPADQVFSVLGDICNVGGKLKPLLWEACEVVLLYGIQNK